MSETGVLWVLQFRADREPWRVLPRADGNGAEAHAGHAEAVKVLARCRGLGAYVMGRKMRYRIVRYVGYFA